MQFRDYVRLLRRGWAVILTLCLLGALAGGVIAATQSRVYEASAKAFFSPPGTNVSELSSAASYTQQIVATYADIATTAYVLKPVMRELHVAGTPTELRKRITVSAVANETVLVVQVTDPSAKRAAAIADAVVRRLAAQVDTLNSTSAKNSPKITLVDEAVPPTSPVRPTPALDIALGAVVGLLLGIALAVAREVFDTRVRVKHDVERITERPILGVTVFDSRARRQPLVTPAQAATPRAEAYRTIRTNLQFLQVDDAMRSIVVSSSVAGEGKSTTAANLALALTDIGERVLLLDADLRRPTIANYFGLDNTLGLSEVLIGRNELDHAIQVIGEQGLSVLPSGALPPNPNELIQSHAMKDLLDRLHERFDRIIIDTPPLLPVTDAAILARRTSGALLVTAMRKVRSAELRTAVARLDQIDAPLLGIVMTMARPRGVDAIDGGTYGYSSKAGGATGRGWLSGEPGTVS